MSTTVTCTTLPVEQNSSLEIVTCTVLPVDQNSSLEIKAESEWLDHVALCFAAKGTPRSYFEQQLRRETKHLILVARHATTIVSTVRIFHRVVIGDNGQHLRVGGIGAVCTLPEFRGQGISTLLLSFACQVLLRKQHMFDVSLLHAAPQFHSFYSARGWCRSLSDVEMMEIKIVPEMELEREWEDEGEEKKKDYRRCVRVRVRALHPSDLPLVQRIYNEYVQRNRLCGCDIRTEERWSSLAHDFQSQMFVASVSSSGLEDRAVVAYCCLSCTTRRKGDEMKEKCWMLSDFCMDESMERDRGTGKKIVRVLVTHALGASEEMEGKKDPCSVQMPLCIGEWFVEEKEEEEEEEEGSKDQGRRITKDSGWLYFALNGKEKNPFGESARRCTRWKLDSF